MTARVLGNVVELQPSLSDAHRGGRSVVALTFASGRRLVYKPKDMGTEAAYQRLLAWLNDQGAPLSFKVLKVLDRSTHGWEEFVPHLPCQNPDEGRRYYERAGMLLCLFYVLEVTDCHYENIVASGEYPVLVDAETVMHHRAGALIPADDNARSEAFDQIDHSVLRTGLLPRWELSADKRTAYHMSGLGEADEQELPVRAPTWVRANTDQMALEPAAPAAHRARERTNPGRPPAQPAGAQPADRRRLPADVRLPAPTPRCTVGIGSAARAGARAGPFRVSTDGHLRAHPLRPPERPLPARRGGPEHPARAARKDSGATARPAGPAR